MGRRKVQKVTSSKKRMMEKRAIDSADLLLKLFYERSPKATIRGVAEIVGYSKSTVHKDITDRLRDIDKTKARKVQKILDLNWDAKAFRGGEATKQKFLNRGL